MHRLLVPSLLMLLSVIVAACQHAPISMDPSPSASPSTPGAATVDTASPTQAFNDRYVRLINHRIAGREDEPAEQVFKNIKWLKGVPAGRLVNIMDKGYSRALGVKCTYCHERFDFSSDDKRAKRAAREMAAMHREINTRLQEMQELELDKNSRFINCATCHRGEIDPTGSSAKK